MLLEKPKRWRTTPVKTTQDSIKMKNRKTFYEIKTVGYLKEIIEIIQSPTTPHPPTPSDKILLHLRNKNFLMEIYRHFLLNALRMQFLDVKKWCSVNAFSHTKQVHISQKICKLRKVFSCVSRAYYFQCQVSWGS